MEIRTGLKEIVEQIEGLLIKGTNVQELHNLQIADGLDALLFWLQVKLCLDQKLWAAELGKKMGQPNEPAVMKYLHDLQNRVRNHLFIVQHPQYKS